MSSFIERYRRRRFVIWVTAGIVFVVLLLLNVIWLGVGPPKEVSISSGDPEAGAYYSFALEYKQELDRLGLGTTIQTSKGSVQNLDRLLNKDLTTGQALAAHQAYQANPMNITRMAASVSPDRAPEGGTATKVCDG